MMNTLWQDLRYGLRMLAKRPGFTFIAVLTLALGIGANTAIFSVINAVLLNPLPFRESERLMALGHTYPQNRAKLSATSYPNFTDWKEQNSVFEQIGAYYTTSLTLTGEEAVRLRGAVVTHDVFDTLGATPAMGRGFLPEEDKAGGGSEGRPALLSWECWRQYFGSDPAVIGRAITLSDKSFTVVGVMPEGFMFPVQIAPTEVWISTARDAEIKGEGTVMISRGYRTWRVIARLKPSVTVEAAQAEMNTIAASLAERFPDYNADVGIKVTPLLESIVGDIRPTLMLLFGAVGFVLLIACVNVANLMLERAINRRKEITVRLALGASRWRIIRQLLAESLVLALAGGSLGVMLALWGTDLILALNQEGITRITQTSIDARVLIFTLLSSLATGAIFGLIPAIAASKVNLTESLKEGGRGSAGSLRHNRTRSALVISEVALALVLLVGAGLLVQSLIRLQRVNAGFDPNNLLTFTVSLPGRKYNAQQTVAFYNQLTDRIAALPGVSAASIVSHLPLAGDTGVTSLEIEGRPKDWANGPEGQIHSTGPGYFRTLGIPFISGRDFTTRDDQTAPPVLIVNEALARLYFPGENPIGKHIRPSFSMGEFVMREIVGVVGDVKHRGLQAEAQPEIYFSYPQMPMSSMTVIVRTSVDPHTLINAVRDQVRSLDREAPVYRISTLNEYIARSLTAPRFNTLLISLFAAVALVLTIVGLYGVISCIVSQSTHEIGIRMALGAQPRAVMKLFMKRGLALTLIGLVMGNGAAIALTRFISNMLFGVKASDFTTFTLISILLIGIAIVACYIPARRAMRVDPIVALRYE
ncbi:MAG: ABC transporter permease [Acidobacteriota bacterium]